MPSIRYSHPRLDARFLFMQLCGWLQGKKVVALRSDPEAATQVLAASNTKGRFIEDLIACPAWEPVYSVESVDGPKWRSLAGRLREIMGQLQWQQRCTPLLRKHLRRLSERIDEDPSRVVDAEQISRLSANVFFDLLFERPMSGYEEDLFFRASVEWRKEIALKGRADADVKREFWRVLESVVRGSRFAPEAEAEAEEIKELVSVFAQPFILSPQINFSDIMATTFTQLREHPDVLARARVAAEAHDVGYLTDVCQEAIRLEHPFPVLEREMTRDLQVGDLELSRGTQVFITLDDFAQEDEFRPERWRDGRDNPYRALPFGAGPRVCLGKALAQEMLGEMLQGLLTQIPLDRLQPSRNHLYSGRDNDGEETWAEYFYQARVFASVLRRSFRIGQARSECPFPHHLLPKLSTSPERAHEPAN